MSEHADVVQAKYGGQQNLLQTGSNSATMAGTDQQILTEMIVTSALPRPAGLPLVDDWHCLRVGHFSLLQRCDDIDMSQQWPSFARACDLCLLHVFLNDILQCTVCSASLMFASHCASVQDFLLMHFCLQGMVRAWEDAQGPLDQYGMQHTRTLANLCNMGVPTQLLGQVARA